MGPQTRKHLEAGWAAFHSRLNCNASTIQYCKPRQFSHPRDFIFGNSSWKQTLVTQELFLRVRTRGSTILHTIWFSIKQCSTGFYSLGILSTCLTIKRFYAMSVVTLWQTIERYIKPFSSQHCSTLQAQRASGNLRVATNSSFFLFWCKQQSPQGFGGEVDSAVSCELRCDAPVLLLSLYSSSHSIGKSNRKGWMHIITFHFPVYFELNHCRCDNIN